MAPLVNGAAIANGVEIARNGRRRPCLCGTNGIVRTIKQVLKLDHLFRAYPDAEDEIH